MFFDGAIEYFCFLGFCYAKNGELIIDLDKLQSDLYIAFQDGYDLGQTCEYSIEDIKTIIETPEDKYGNDWDEVYEKPIW